MLIFVLVFGLIIVTLLIYFFLMFFYPEWVGITGKAAKQYIEQHEAGSQGHDIDLMDR